MNAKPNAIDKPEQAITNRGIPSPARTIEDAALPVSVGDSDESVDDSVEDPVGSPDDGLSVDSAVLVTTTVSVPLGNIGVSPGGIDMTPVSVERSDGKPVMLTVDAAVGSLMGKMLMMPSSASVIVRDIRYI